MGQLGEHLLAASHGRSAKKLRLPPASFADPYILNVLLAAAAVLIAAPSSTAFFRGKSVLLADEEAEEGETVLVPFADRTDRENDDAEEGEAEEYA